MRDAFGFNLEQFIFYGGYPGASDFIKDPPRWKNYILDALIEKTCSRDILLMTRIDKPALLRRLFEIACKFSGQIVAYQKMLGQLQDAGNATTLAHYLELLSGVGMVAGIKKFTGSYIRQRSSSPKLQVFNTALISAQSSLSFTQAREEPQLWGHLVESTIGAHLLNSIQGTDIRLYYWRELNHEVDFILERGNELVDFEVKSRFLIVDFLLQSALLLNACQ